MSRSHLDQVETVLGTVLWVKREGSALTVGLESTPEQSGTRDGLLITAIWKPEYAWLVVHREVPRALVHRSHFGG